jgi:hypothetical protein
MSISSTGLSKDEKPGIGHNRPPSDLPLIERLRIISLPEAARLAGCSVDNLKRHHADRLIRLSPRRLGMRLQDALMLNRNTTLPEKVETSGPFRS